MKQNHIWSYLIRLLPIVLVCVSCQSGGGQKDQSQETNVTQQLPTAVAPSGYYISNDRNEAVAEISIDGEAINIKVGQETLYGDWKSGKRKYYDHKNQLKYSVKIGDGGGFKIRNHNETLAWKVKWKGGKTKIADNEEMDNAYAITTKDGNRIKVKQHEQEVGVVRFAPNDQQAKVGDKLVTVNFGESHALGILLIEQIPDKARHLICAELLKAGR